MVWYEGKKMWLIMEVVKIDRLMMVQDNIFLFELLSFDSKHLLWP